MVTTRAGRRRAGKPSRRPSDHIAALEQEFRTALGVRVKITHDARGRGKLVIAFGSHEEFDQVRSHICGGDTTATRTGSQAGSRRGDCSPAAFPLR